MASLTMAGLVALEWAAVGVPLAHAAEPAAAKAPASALAATAAPEGKATFARYCAECHAPGFGHPGTQQLTWTRGANRGVLEQRKDLVTAYVAAVVRNGLVEMPAFRPTEITDAQLAQLADYVANAGKKKRS